MLPRGKPLILPGAIHIGTATTDSDYTGATAAVSPLPGTGLAFVDRHPKFYFNNDLIAVQVENTLFNVHKHQLLKSTTLSNMFTIAGESESKRTSHEGASLDHPIVMQGVSASDFECLLKVLYINHFLQDHQLSELNPSIVVPAFRLANMWKFEELCSYLNPLAERVLGQADKIAFARQFNITEWLVPAHVKLCLRQERITAQEASKVGLDSLLFISRFREENPKKVYGTSYCASCSRANGYHHYQGSSLSLIICARPRESEVMEMVQAWLDGGCRLSD
ncbi:hypothetical protein FRC09_001866 [Ceratobasidium sp. 395]|nr:hypothetical protein FRC09_001866 [Ceratobasidium sp. 395]